MRLHQTFPMDQNPIPTLLGLWHTHTHTHTHKMYPLFHSRFFHNSNFRVKFILGPSASHDVLMTLSWWLTSHFVKLTSKPVGLVQASERGRGGEDLRRMGRILWISVRYIQFELCIVLNVFCKALCTCKIWLIRSFDFADRIYSLFHSDGVRTHNPYTTVPSVPLSGGK